ncbi:MAG: hypothetical protein L6W00_09785 [Lentisphaeria bacterium]|nr:MAG: hypothetical protein L6W00_09785 [Lentisphaeria bacterium]
MASASTVEEIPNVFRRPAWNGLGHPLKSVCPLFPDGKIAIPPGSTVKSPIPVFDGMTIMTISLKIAVSEAASAPPADSAYNAIYYIDSQ